MHPPHNIWTLFLDLWSDLHWSQPGEKRLTGGTNWQPKPALSTTWNSATMVRLSHACTYLVYHLTQTPNKQMSCVKRWKLYCVLHESREATLRLGGIVGPITVQILHWLYRKPNGYSVVTSWKRHLLNDLLSIAGIGFFICTLSI